VYIGKLQLSKWIKKNLSHLRGKKLFFYIVAATPPDQMEKRAAFTLEVPEEIRSDCRFFHLPGSMTKSKLSWMDRFMLKIGAKLTKDPVERMTMLTDFDDVKKEHLEEIIQEVQKLTGALPSPGNRAQYAKIC
jgi:menaquinone-dependent protoporphyrinogen IX oxidase